MAEQLTRTEQAIIKAMTDLGATKEAGIKSASEITKKANRPMGLVTNTLSALAQKKVVKRIAKEKSAGYYVIKA